MTAYCAAELHVPNLSTVEEQGRSASETETLKIVNILFFKEIRVIVLDFTSVLQNTGCHYLPVRKRALHESFDVFT
jgi:hypothetical protein